MEREPFHSADDPLRAERGSVLVEYVVLFSLVSLGWAAATAALGPKLLRTLRVQHAVLLLPMPG